MKLNAEDQDLIRTEWRDGKYKNLSRLEELAQLHACTVPDICAVVGLDPAKYKGATGTRRIVNTYDDALKHSAVLAVIQEGLSHKESAAKFGVPVANVSVWVRKFKARQAENAAPAEKSKAHPEEHETAPQKILAELRAGIAGLHAFTDILPAWADILSGDERAVLDRVLHTASGFARGVEAGLALASAGRKSSEN